MIEESRIAHRTAFPDIVCPECGSGRLKPGEITAGQLRCRTCRSSFTVAGAVLDLLPADRESRSLSQLLMEWGPLVRIYESRLWRRSLAFTVMTGISFDREWRTIEEAAELHGEETVLDLACGTGLYTRRLACRVPRGAVVAVDRSRPMLELAAQAAAAQALDNVLFVRASALDLPFETGSFTTANCCAALHLFPDPDRALDEVARVLAPGGHFTVATLLEPGLPLAGCVASVREAVLGVRAFRRNELAERLEHAGFVNVTIHHAQALWLIASARKAASEAALPNGHPVP